MLVADDGVGVGSLPRQLLVEPRQRGRDARVLIAQALDELDEEGVRIDGVAMRREHGAGRFGDAVARTEQLVSRLVRRAASGPAGDHPLGDTPEVLDEHDAQGDRHRPQLADGERLHLLIGAQVAAQDLRIEVAVGVGDEGPGHAQHARIVRERSAGQLGQLAIVAGRQVRADLANLLFDHMEIVDQPLGGRGDGRARVDRGGDVPIGALKHSFVFGQPPGQRGALQRTRGDRLGGGEAARVVFEPFDAEQFGADRRRIVPRRGRPRAYAQPHERRDQRALTAGFTQTGERIGFNEHGLAALQRALRLAILLRLAPPS